MQGHVGVWVEERLNRFMRMQALLRQVEENQGKTTTLFFFSIHSVLCKLEHIVMATKTADMETAFQAACDDGTIPGAILAATNRDGSFNYAKAFGFRSLDGETKPKCELDTVLALFSATKLVTTIAALQLVEQGKISLEGDTASLLPELASLPILLDMKDGEAELRERQNPITLRYST